MNGIPNNLSCTTCLHVNYVSMLNLSGKHKKHLLFACQHFDCEHVRDIM